MHTKIESTRSKVQIIKQRYDILTTSTESKEIGLEKWRKEYEEALGHDIDMAVLV
jgi:hypothetical protein